MSRWTLNPVGPIVAGLGSLAMLIAVFLPRVESSTFTLAGIQENTLIQSGQGWIFLGCAIGGLGATYGANTQDALRWVVVLLGVVTIGAATYYGTDKASLTLYRLDFNGERNSKESIEAEPGVGMYVAGVGGLLLAAGGFRLTRREGAEAPPPAPREPVRGRLDRLQQLTELRDAGTLSAEEFEREKARILA